MCPKLIMDSFKIERKSYQFWWLSAAIQPFDYPLKGQFKKIIRVNIWSYYIYRILGTSGQPVKDIYKYSELKDGLEILDKTLEWGHLAPTAPDTLGLSIVKVQWGKSPASRLLKFGGGMVEWLPCQTRNQPHVFKSNQGQASKKFTLIAQYWLVPGIDSRMCL